MTLSSAWIVKTGFRLPKNIFTCKVMDIYVPGAKYVTGNTRKSIISPSQCRPVFAEPVGKNLHPVDGRPKNNIAISRNARKKKTGIIAKKLKNMIDSITSRTEKEGRIPILP